MNCPCGSETNYESCCEPVIRGKVKAPTAEALMRSRYAAFALAEVNHLRDSLAPESRTDFDPDTTRQWAEKSKWLGLQIISTEKGKAEDAVGTVEFVAKYSVEGKTTEHREKSDFRKEDGTWYFVDGHIHAPGTLVREAPKTGRNDPCHCGSGKKFKKCCGT